MSTLFIANLCSLHNEVRPRFFNAAKAAGGLQMDDAAYLARMPALAAYVERIGAEQKNFRKYVIPATDEPMPLSRRSHRMIL